MKVAVQQEDLHLLAKNLQEQLLAEVPSAEVFEVKCAINKDELMVLVQHKSGVIVDSELIFVVIKEVLQSLAPQKEQQVQCFLRVFGEQFPYTKRLLALKPEKVWEGWGDEEAEGQYFSPVSSSLAYSPLIDIDEEEEPFDPFANTPNLPTSKARHHLKFILLGIAFAGVVVLGGAYFLSAPCVISECKEIQNAEQLKTTSSQLMRRAKFEKELVALEQQLAATSAALNTIPSWSSRYQVSEDLKANLSEQALKINQVVKALQMASLAAQKTQTPVHSLEKLQARQHLWRQAIAPLEAISSNSELYGLAQEKLFSYRVNLHVVNQQIVIEEKWLKKLIAAKAVANAAENQEEEAKSLNDWQKVQSTWLVVVNALNIIPKTSPGYQEAQKLLVDYKPKLAAARDRVTKEQLAAKTYQQAVSSAKQAKVYEQQNQWLAAATYWNQALRSAKQIDRDRLYYTQAQSLIEPYSAALKQVQEKLQVVSNLQQTRTDLGKTCINRIRICIFNIDNRGIIVRLTPEYDQIRQNNLVNPNSENSLSTAVEVTNHLQILREALAIISDNANLSLFLYNSQGQVIYTRTLIK